MLYRSSMKTHHFISKVLLPTTFALAGACSQGSPGFDEAGSSSTARGAFAEDGGVAAVFATDAAGDGDAAASGENGQQIALTVTSTAADSYAVVDVAIGADPPFKAVVDTGSSGLRVVQGAVTSASWTAAGIVAPSVVYGAIEANGEVMTATVKIGGVAIPSPIKVEHITSARCTPGHATCGAANGDVSALRFRGETKAVLGIGMRVSPGLSHPLAALGKHAQYIVALGAYGATTGNLLVDPGQAELDRFRPNLAHLKPSAALSADGLTGWDDQHVPFCINSFCGEALLEMAGGAARVVLARAPDFQAIGVASGASLIPTGTALREKLINDSAVSLTVGATPSVGLDAIAVGYATGGTTTSLGILPFFQKDVLYDFAAGTIGVADKK